MKFIESEVLGFVDDEDGVAKGTSSNEFRGDWDDVARKILIERFILVSEFGVSFFLTLRGSSILLHVGHEVVIVVEKRSKICAVFVFFGAF